MKKITREQAEQLFLVSNVLNTKVEQDKNQLRVFMTLSDNKSCLVQFDLKNQQKNYFLEKTKP